MTAAEENPFASPHSAQAPRREIPTEIEGTSPLDVRGYCYACGAAGEQDFQQDFYSGRLLVDYSLCQNCFWRRRWQRWSLMVNAALLPTIIVIMTAFIGLSVTAFVFSLLKVEPSLAIAVGMGLGIFGGLFFASLLVFSNVTLRVFAVFHWYPTRLRHGFYRLTALDRNFAANYFQRPAEEE